MAGPNPFTDPKSWSTLLFLGKPPNARVQIPGIIMEIDGHDPQEMWIVQKAQNSSFASTIWRGRLLNESIKLKVLLPDSQSFDTFQVVKERLQPKPPKTFDAVDAALGGSIGNVQVWNVQNGALNFGGVTRVGIRSIGTPRAQANLSWIASIDLIQYRPRIISKVGPPDPPKRQETENDRLAKELDAVIKEAKKL